MIDMIHALRANLGEPFFATNDCLIYNTDCLKAMNHIDQAIVDLTVTSPPYNIGKEYECPLPLNEYLDWCESWVTAIYRITKPQGAFWLNVGYVELPRKAKAIPLPYLLWNRVPFFLIQEIVWNYGAGVSAKRMLSPRNEKFLWYVKSPNRYTFNLDAIRDKNVKYPNQKKHGRLRCNPLGKNPTDVWEIPKVTSGTDRSSKERTPHPAQFPLDVTERIIKACSDMGDLVLDPFMGSGTTAEACLRNRRRFLGFEVSLDYCRIATKRINACLNAMRIERAQITLL